MVHGVRRANAVRGVRCVMRGVWFVVCGEWSGCGFVPRAGGASFKNEDPIPRSIGKNILRRTATLVSEDAL